MLHVLTYSQEYSHFGVGVRVFEEVIRNCIEQEFERIDLLAPASDFKASWTQTSEPVSDYALAMTLKGRAFAAGYVATLRPALRHATAWWASTVAPRLARLSARGTTRHTSS